MKSKLFLSLFTLLTAMTAWADVEINETNFPDKKFRNWVLSQDYGADGVLKKKEIAKVSTINVDGLGVQSLKGIEFFTALKYLSCQNNQLTELDVSNNKELAIFSCYQNKISGDAMDRLIASLPPKKIVPKKFNAERDLDNLATNISREKGFCIIGSENEQNVMTAAQVARAKKKGWIPRAHNGYAWYEYAGSDQSKPEGVEINEENFPDENFRVWLLRQDYGGDGVLTKEEGAKVSFIRITKGNIRSLKGIEYFKKLKNLICIDNQLDSLDVSQNTQLEILVCPNNNLSTLDVSHNTKLKELRCQDNLLTSINVTGCSVLSSLWCHDNQLTTLDVSTNAVLTELKFSQNKIRGTAMDALTESLPTVNSGKLYVVSRINEHNVMTVEQVNAAKAKGWTVLEY